MSELAVHMKQESAASSSGPPQQQQYAPWPNNGQVAPWPQQQQPYWQPQMAPPPQQMHTTNTNVVITSQPTVATRPAQRPWSSNLCGCCSDFSSCMLALCCPCCLQCCIAQDMGESCGSAFCYVCCSVPSLFGLRANMRGKENIQGSLCDDFCLTAGCCVLWCYCCALAQLAREVKTVKNAKGYV
ncbi:placenta-specific gene 8 protein-like [Biomphalaria glabrata]|uniref:Placenta-specific gene 8 protein-like n=1 Tax=Biomphalaria glabrata TaxID=6526 RepID=A0A9W2ZB97_BIOGL|nr:placenta-specific gene 8 protein-like [Biomphalaria glabrata]